ncbi:multidrug effflux MFS transporter [Paracoccus aminophilus]|uniref:Bcr/CflA family efflux transporter n=1 Tax=Paracoccus aminophilus JCM 7686 TaxID=1367847 RepID=S5XU46_PARAH|nr:multidrug effflux MFS transporter [Paracoccus aminophilus]AGT08712.1 MFS transporter [Paracoccus aminophilus JCM 7686]
MQASMFRMALLLGLLSAVGPFAIDMYLPALPQIAHDLGASDARAQQTLSIYFLVFGVAQMIYGPMADAIGRRKPLLIGVGLFLVASLAATLAQDMTTLIIARAFQALGAATLMVVPRAIVRDSATGTDATRMMAAIMIVISISPMLAPMFGSGVMAFAGWRSIFGCLAAASVIALLLILFVLPETQDPKDRQPVRLDAMLAGMKTLLQSRRFMGLSMIGGFAMASFFVYLAAAPFVYTGQYELSPTGFSVVFAINAIGFFAASQFAGRLGELLGMERLIAYGVTGFLIATALLTLVVWAGFQSLPLIVAGLFIANAFLGVVMPTAMVLSLDPHPQIAGLASSLGGTLQMLTGSAMIALCGGLFSKGAIGMVGAILICAALAWVSAVLALPRLRLALRA